MRRLTLTISLCVIFAVNAVAQWSTVPNLTTYDKRKFHFGFFLGTNYMDFGFNYYSMPSLNPNYIAPSSSGDGFKYDPNSNVVAEVSSLTLGFTVGITTSLRINSWLDLRFLPGMSFGERKITYSFPKNGTYPSSSVDEGDIVSTPYSYVAKSTYIDLPILFKFKAQRAVNFRPYFVAGASCRIDLETRDDDDDLVKLNGTSYMAEVGVGFDSFLQYFKFSTELRYGIGINNVLGDIPDPKQVDDFDPQFMYPLKGLRPHVVTLIFYFE
ncbi:PorT family protein [Halosquirtibacter laminarini]|uniref:PorT family protein n=1 Tax=Halosquirtibacter laminarini TaxID=3374600 RepID=A0AC61NH02_9BACT|nr:PorT family protein [Prolixibacteraceae bacterium]